MNSNANIQKGEKFPLRLHSFLELTSSDAELSSIVSWLPDGKSFSVHDQVAFAERVLPVHFGGMNSYKSFRRQLNLYGITKNTHDQNHARNATGEQLKN
jgi:HSF-type DNA-binding